MWTSSSINPSFCRGDGHFRGLQEVKEFFTKLLHHIDSQVDRYQFVEAGDHIIAIARLHG
jgi:hypothetical protein